MNLTFELINKGFLLCNVEYSDFATYYTIARACYEKYVNEYFGAWVEESQIKMNQTSFNNEMKETCFKKILYNDSIVGFLAFDVQDDKIDSLIIQMLECAQNKGLGSFYLNHITSLAKDQNKPAFLRVFKSNPAQNLYKRFGFRVYDKTISHYLMKYEPKLFCEQGAEFC